MLVVASQAKLTFQILVYPSWRVQECGSCYLTRIHLCRTVARSLIQAPRMGLASQPLCPTGNYRQSGRPIQQGQSYEY